MHTNNYFLNKTKYTEKKLFLGALLIRVCCLFIIIIFADVMGSDFNQNALDPDDRRYIAGAVYFSENANSIFDIDTLTQGYENLGDYSGYYIQNINTMFSKGTLWYIISCFFLYLFNISWTINFLNIIVSSTSVIILYRLCGLIGTEKMARRAANLLAFLPYPVIFSCFAYKDSLVMFCFLYLLYCSILYKNKLYDIESKYIFFTKIILISMILLLLRSGFSVLMGIFFFSIAFDMKRFIIYNYFKNFSIKTIILIIMMLLCIVAVSYSYSILQYKLEAYLNLRSMLTSKNTISFLTINNIEDLYRLPFCYLFSGVMPINMFRGISSWYDIVTNINIVMVPIAIGATMYIFIKQKINKFIYWGWMTLYCITIITSINIFRHYYSLLPLTLIAYSDFIIKASKGQKIIFLFSSLAMIMLLVIFYLFKS